MVPPRADISAERKDIYMQQYTVESNEIAARYMDGEKLNAIAIERGMTKQAIHAKLKRRNDWDAVRKAHSWNKREKRQKEISKLCIPCNQTVPMKPQQQYCQPRCYYAAKVGKSLREWLEARGVDAA